MADRDAIVSVVQQPRRAHREHIEAGAQALDMADLQNVGMEVRHSDQRAIAVRREWVEDIVGRDRAIAAVLDEQVRIDHAPADVEMLVATH